MNCSQSSYCHDTWPASTFKGTALGWISIGPLALKGNAMNDFGSWIRKNSARPWFAEFFQIQLRPAKWPIQNRSRRCLKGRNNW